jgi:hypothetical protein
LSTQQAQQRKAASVHLQALFNHATDLAAGQCSGVASAQLRNAIQQAANLLQSATTCANLSQPEPTRANHYNIFDFH